MALPYRGKQGLGHTKYVTLTPDEIRVLRVGYAMRVKGSKTDFR